MDIDGETGGQLVWDPTRHLHVVLFLWIFSSLSFAFSTSVRMHRLHESGLDWDSKGSLLIVTDCKKPNVNKHFPLLKQYINDYTSIISYIIIIDYNFMIII